jgi:hypothetical protein
MSRLAAVVVSLAVLVPPSARAALAPCGTSPTPPAAWEHVVWIWFENHGYGSVVGSSAAPFINRTLARRCGLATHYQALAHPSLPNYIAATSGLALDALGPLRDDCNATGDCHTNADSLFAQVPSWGAYEESMRRPCTHWFTGPYAASHNPPVYYRNLDGCAEHDVALGRLWRDLDADTLPAFAFVTPNMCHSMHDCSVAEGDAWLRHVVKRLTASAAYGRGTMAIFVTFDESAKDDPDNRVAMLVVSPSTPPRTRARAGFTHYSLLRTTEEMLGVDRLLGEARHARSMRPAFNL